MEPLHRHQGGRSQQQGHRIAAVLAEDLEAHREGHTGGGGHHPGQHPVDRWQGVEREIGQPQDHQQGEGQQQHPGQGHQGPPKAMEEGAHVHRHVDLVRPREEAGHREAGEELLIAQPAALLHHDPLAPGRKATAEGREGHLQHPHEQLLQGGRIGTGAGWGPRG